MCGESKERSGWSIMMFVKPSYGSLFAVLDGLARIVDGVIVICTLGYVRPDVETRVILWMVRRERRRLHGKR